MEAKTFKLIDGISREGIDNGNWGLFQGPCETSDYLGTKESMELGEGDYLYIYHEDDGFAFIKQEPDYRLTMEDDGVVDVFKIQ